MSEFEYKKTIIFCRTRRGAERLTSGLNKNGFPVHVLHGNKSQFSRKTILNTLKQNFLVFGKYFPPEYGGIETITEIIFNKVKNINQELICFSKKK